MVYDGKYYKSGWFGGTIIFGNTQMGFPELITRNLLELVHPEPLTGSGAQPHPGDFKPKRLFCSFNSADRRRVGSFGLSGASKASCKPIDVLVSEMSFVFWGDMNNWRVWGRRYSCFAFKYKSKKKCVCVCVCMYTFFLFKRRANIEGVINH